MLENKADDIAYCGLYCVDCPVLGVEIADLAGKLKEKLGTAIQYKQKSNSVIP